MAVQGLKSSDNGLIPQFYYLLWMKNQETGTGCPILLPDTIVYRYTQAAYWFFSSSIDGSIKLKNKSNTVSANIIKAFSARKESAASEICGYYISNTEDTGTEIEYVTYDNLGQFLLRTKENNGIFQKWVDPKGPNNAVIQAVWLPQFCLLERRCNVRKISDRRVNVYERAVTFEGDEHHSEPKALNGTTLSARIGLICQAMVSHIAAVTNGRVQITRMVAHFKLAADDRIYFLWCSNIRVNVEGSERNVDGTLRRVSHLMGLNLNLNLTVPPSVHLSGTPMLRKQKRGSTGFVCISCNATYEEEKRSQVTYALIVEQFTTSRTGKRPSACGEWSTLPCCGGMANDVKMEPSSSSSPSPPTSRPPQNNTTTTTGPRTTTTTTTTTPFRLAGARTKCISNTNVPPLLKKLHPNMDDDQYVESIQDSKFLLQECKSICEGCFLAMSNSSSLGGLYPSPRASRSTKVGDLHLPPAASSLPPAAIANTVQRLYPGSSLQSRSSLPTSESDASTTLPIVRSQSLASTRKKSVKALRSLKSLEGNEGVPEEAFHALIDDCNVFIAQLT